MATIAEALALALRHHQAGSLHEAELLYRQILQADPCHVDALHLLGVLATQVGRGDLGVEYISQALRLQPSFAEAHHSLGNALRSLGRLDEAAACYREAGRLQPDYAEAHNSLGMTLRQQGRPDLAADCYRRVLQLRPDNAEAHCNLGNALKDQGRFDEAIDCYQQALRLQPDHVRALNNLGTALQEHGHLAPAVACYQRALRCQPDYAAAHNNLGAALLAQGRVDEAAACYQEAVRLQPEYADAHRNLGGAYHRRGQFAEAAASFREVLRLRPGDPTALHLLAAMTQSATPDRAPPSYVADTFDAYADDFDQHLLTRLGYRGPELLREALGDAPAPNSLDVLDLGCGTGLCGLAFRDWARTLTGVDLSPRMLARARARGIYQHLLPGDLLVPLNATEAGFDLILAGDVFCYLGDLAAVLRASRQALRPGGRLAFLVEAHDGEGYVLRPSGRFAHSLAHVRRLAGEAGLTERHLNRAVSRTEGGQAIESFVLVLQKSGPPSEADASQPFSNSS